MGKQAGRYAALHVDIIERHCQVSTLAQGLTQIMLMVDEALARAQERRRFVLVGSRPSSRCTSGMGRRRGGTAG